MTKQKKPSKSSLEGPREKPSSKPKKMGSEIDDIFAGKKRKRVEKEKNSNTDKPVKASAANGKSHDKTRIGKKDKSKSFKESGLAEPTTTRQSKKTADGLTIYTEEELGIGKPDAGGTPLCPFDCDCCF